MIKQFLCGNTVKIRWVNSGVIPTSLGFAVYNGSETLVDSGVATSSLTGGFYYLHTVANTPGMYVAETNATIGGKPYKNREQYQAVLQDVN